MKIDKTAPVGVSATFARAPDSNDWFNHPVAAAFAGQDGLSGISSCTSSTYAGADTASAALSGTCTDMAGNTSAGSVGFKYDATPPAVTLLSRTARRTAKGWYRKPLTVSFTGTDATSGIAACRGPDPVTPGPRCRQRDRRRLVPATQPETPPRRARPFQYDATAPTLRRRQGRGREGRREDRLAALGGCGARRARALPGDQRQEKNHCLQRQRRELHRQDCAQRRPLSLRDPGKRRRRQHGRESRHSGVARRRCSTNLWRALR